MAKWEFSSTSAGTLRSRVADYGNATDICFVFPEVKAGFRLPKDATKSEVLEVLEKLIVALKEENSVIITPARYHREVMEYQERLQLTAHNQG